jgi:hypothetical protein
MLKEIFICVNILIFSVQYSYTQGCSDAGFCSLKYHVASLKKNELTLGSSVGVTDGATFINNSYLNYTRLLNKNLFWDTKVTANYASGSLANHFNIGDVFTNLSYNFWKNKRNSASLSLLAGIKIPLSDANAKAGNNPLPMAYQASLGTVDLLTGVSYKVTKWQFSHALQIPLNKENKNSFLKEISGVNDFPSTNRFGRKADMLIRAAYIIKKPASKISIHPAILAIWHLGEDEYEKMNGKREVLQGSNGLTLNANIIGRYTFPKQKSIELSLATPFVVRDIRPDGLTRKFTATVEYKIPF